MLEDSGVVQLVVGVLAGHLDGMVNASFQTLPGTAASTYAIRPRKKLYLLWFSQKAS